MKWKTLGNGGTLSYWFQAGDTIIDVILEAEGWRGHLCNAAGENLASCQQAHPNLEDAQRDSVDFLKRRLRTALEKLDKLEYGNQEE